MTTNPFDHVKGGFFVLVNDEERQSLLPPLGYIPDGRRVVYGEADRAAWPDHVETRGPILGERVGVTGWPSASEVHRSTVSIRG